MPDLPDWVKPGAWFVIPSLTDDTRKYHVRAIVDGRAVMRTWWTSKQRWHYVVEDPEFFEINAAPDRILKRGMSYEDDQRS